MSVGSNDVLKPILLRSSTPGANEKVLMYLESMNRSSKDESNLAPVPEASSSVENGSPQKAPHIWAPSPRSSGANRLEELAGSHVSYAGQNNGGGGGAEEDAASNVQEGTRSEVGGALPAHMQPQHEPGPGDPPGPRYESFDSGPSFGNFGPLPADTSNGAYPTWSTFRPTWQMNTAGSPLAAGGQLPDGASHTPIVPLREAQSPWMGVALPNSPSPAPTASVGINVQGPSTSSGSKARHTESSKTTPSVVQSQTKDTTVDPGTARSPPQKAASHVSDRTARSKATTAYPPLPESRIDSPSSPSSPTSPKHKAKKAPSKAYSISPSDSPSQPPKHHRSRLRSTSGETVEPDVASPRSAAGGSRLPSVPAGNAASPSIGSGGAAGASHQNRPFSPHRLAATHQDLLHAAVLGAAIATDAARDPSPHRSKHGGSAASSPSKSHKSSHSRANDPDRTPTQSRVQSPVDTLDPAEAELVREALTRTRTSYAGSALEPEIVNSHFHDMDLCILLHQIEDPLVHEVVKKALRKAIRQRVKKLGLKHDAESLRQYRRSFHDHDPSVHLQPDFQPTVSETAPEWAKELKEGMDRMQARLDELAPKLDRLKLKSSAGDFQATMYSEGAPYTQTQTPVTQTVKIHTQPTGTMADSMFQPGETEIIVDGDDYDADELVDEMQAHPDVRGVMSEYASGARDDSPGQQYLEEELYKLRVKPTGSQSGVSHRTWDIGPAAETVDDDAYSNDADRRNAVTESGIPEIPDNANYTDGRTSSPPLPPLPQDSQRDLVASSSGQGDRQVWQGNMYASDQPTPWQRIHQRLLSWAIVWPMAELDRALNSTTRGMQVDEVALSIWSTQTYKRYVRSKMTDAPGARVDRLFVPPNMADAINNAVFHGRHGDASGMLRELWTPFGLDGMPRLLIVLAKHRSDENHWVVHRFSLPDGALTTYDSFPERTLPDGRPLGWWFAIRVAWQNAIYPSPDNLMQKMVRLHRPMQLGIDNSVAAAGIWRNLLMGSRAERSLDLERLRDLINTEVKNLRQRKVQGKLSIGGPRPTWEDMN